MTANPAHYLSAMSSPAQKRSAQELSLRHAANRPAAPPGNLMVCLHNIRSMHNVGSAFRSCDAFAVGRLLLGGYTPHPPRLEISKTALGADEWVPWEYDADGPALIRRYQSQGYAVVAVEQTHRSLPLAEGLPHAGRSPFVLVFGNEVLGLDDDLLAMADHVVEIPQYGKKHSLNVAVSIGIALYAAQMKAAT